MPWFCDCLPGCCPGWSVDGKGTPRHGDPFSAARYVPPVITPAVVPDPVPREPRFEPPAVGLGRVLDAVIPKLEEAARRRADDESARRGAMALAAIGFALHLTLLAVGDSDDWHFVHEKYPLPRFGHNFKCVRCTTLCGPHDPLYRHEEFCWNDTCRATRTGLEGES